LALVILLILSGGILSILWGSAGWAWENSEVDFWELFVQIRLPRTGLAILGGGALAMAGYWMQLLFRNPLASPSILGVTNGASMGVSFVTMGLAFLNLPLRPDAMMLASLLGALLILVLLFVVRWRVQSLTGLLIFGVMTGHLAGAIESIFQRWTERGNLSGLVYWSMGSFDQGQPSYLLYLTLGLFITIVLMWRSSKALDAWSLGDEAARSLGISLGKISVLLMISAGALTAIVTAMAGPIAFIGLASSHIARLWWPARNYKRLWIPVLLTGMAIAIFCDLISRCWGIPINAVTSLIGAPWVMFWILKNKNHVF
jgi:iron complex transport system permease protein